MKTSPERAGARRPASRRDIWIMVTGVAMFLLSFAPWEGLSPETVGNLGLGNVGGLGNTPIGPGSIYNAWQVNLGGWLPCLVALAIAGAVAAHDFFGVHVPGVAGTRPRFLLQAVAVISMLLLTLRAFSLFLQHNQNIGQARWGVYLAFIVGLTQFALVIAASKKTGRVATSAVPGGSPAPTRAPEFCSQCGTRAAAEGNFCGQCGAPMATPPEAFVPPFGAR
jgi:hypothetical protein